MPDDGLVVLVAQLSKMTQGGASTAGMERSSTDERGLHDAEGWRSRESCAAGHVLFWSGLGVWHELQAAKQERRLRVKYLPRVQYLQ